ncbi:hypothetical protein BS47DRAFT_496656 [Hydnum rufescens UP504]|uniref:Uncharacterized protein n=1 Tax=Hydnum rufescens UP504 TaxID=1448309 RepID=A0A9P6AI62_9AGAM|nr:hypothetical protein BS47DRAFT_496656 [Hydnum rufescens UP504]
MSESDLDLEPVQEYPSTDQARSTGWVHIDEISPLHHEELDPNLNGGVMSEEVHNLVEEELEEIQAQELGSGETPIESVPAEPEQATLDWAADEGGLPSLSALENSFGKSGAATPVAPSSSTLPNYLPPHQFAHTNGDRERHRTQGKSPPSKDQGLAHNNTSPLRFSSILMDL